MKMRYLMVAVVLTIILPQLLFSFASKKSQQTAESNIETVEEESIGYSILVKDKSTVLSLNIEEYVAGVVLAEMPVDFETEALKAQAVAARTYTLHRISKGGKHPEADICTDSTCCQAYAGISKNDVNAEKVKCAVMETEGQVLTYQGKLIEATYFSCSGGKTEDAIAVWGTDVPYLKSVASPGEENCRHYEKSLEFTTDAFLNKLGLSDNSNLSNRDISVTYTSGGGVKTIVIAGHSYSGVQIRNLLGLSSTAFSINIDGRCVCITTRGNGHRVGMSQYGAEAMAVEGKDYTQILEHYYSGTELQTISEQQLNAIFDKDKIL